MAYAHGISYTDYLKMSNEEINEAIIGAQLRQRNELSLIRTLTHSLLSYIGGLKPNVKPSDLQYFIFDKKTSNSKNIKDSEEWQKMQEDFRRRDALKRDSKLKEKK
jgi:hypothetical protein